MNARKMAGMTGMAVVAIAVLLVDGMAQADITIETVRVGNAGNTGELSGEGAGGYGPSRTCGAVAYPYNIGKYEVTAGQYTAFLNAVAVTDTYELYDTNMDTTIHFYGCNITRTGSSGSYAYSVTSDWANRPVNFVTWGDSVRFANWLTNGQGNGSTETGAYNLNGAMTNAQLMAVVVPDAAQRATWSSGAKSYFLLTSEDEWYKAAYYKGGSTTAGYWDYPTSSNATPSNDLTTPDGGNNANFNQSGYTVDSPYYRTPVGEFKLSDSPYGTFDQGGNVVEWNEALITPEYENTKYRGLRGGSFLDTDPYLLALVRDYHVPAGGSGYIGFRVSEVPEPASMAVLALGSIGMLLRRRFGFAHRKRGLGR